MVNKIRVYSKSDYIIIVCDNAKERFSEFHEGAKVFHHIFNDPAKATGTEAEIKEAFATDIGLIKRLFREICKRKTKVASLLFLICITELIKRKSETIF